MIEPHPGVVAYYDGRIPGVRAYSGEPNWLDEGGFALGIASYAIVDGADALVYDTHLSVAHAEAVRRDLLARGVTRMRVVLSHWHLDHIAGNAAFADCEIIALGATAALMREHRQAIEAGSHAGLPAIRPLVLPTTELEGEHSMWVGRREVQLRPMDIHSRDGLVLHLPEDGLLLAGDTLEDSVTYVAEPDRLEQHLRDIDRLAALGAPRILPNHGDPGIIAGGGYGPGLVGATERYVRKLLRAVADEEFSRADLRSWLADDLAAGHVTWFEPYAEVHRNNVAAVRAR